MKQENQRWKWALGVWAVLALTACNEVEIQQSKDWVDKMEQFRGKTEQAIPLKPYRTEQQVIFKEYFGELVRNALRIKEDEKVAKQFNKWVSKQDLNQVCSRVFIRKTDWESVNVGCTKNGFYLCSEDVRAYPDTLKTLRESLSPDQQKRFNEAKACQEAVGS